MMAIKPGAVMRTSRGDLVMVCYPNGEGQWACDDGWTYPAADLSSVSEEEAAPKREDARRAARLVADFDAWATDRRAEGEGQVGGWNDTIRRMVDKDTPHPAPPPPRPERS